MEENPPTQDSGPSNGREAPRPRTQRAAFSAPEPAAPKAKPADRDKPGPDAAKAAPAVTFQPPPADTGPEAAAPEPGRGRTPRKQKPRSSGTPTPTPPKAATPGQRRAVAPAASRRTPGVAPEPAAPESAAAPHPDAPERVAAPQPQSPERATAPHPTNPERTTAPQHTSEPVPAATPPHSGAHRVTPDRLSGRDNDEASAIKVPPARPPRKSPAKAATAKAAPAESATPVTAAPAEAAPAQPTKAAPAKTAAKKAGPRKGGSAARKGTAPSAAPAEQMSIGLTAPESDVTSAPVTEAAATPVDLTTASGALTSGTPTLQPSGPQRSGADAPAAEPSSADHPAPKEFSTEKPASEEAGTDSAASQPRKPDLPPASGIIPTQPSRTDAVEAAITPVRPSRPEPAGTAPGAAELRADAPVPGATDDRSTVAAVETAGTRGEVPAELISAVEATRTAARVAVPTAWSRIVADPGHMPELLALAAVQLIGPRAADWARDARESYPSADRTAIARLAIQQFSRRAGIANAFASVAGSYAPVALLGTTGWTHAELVLHVAAAFGQDPTDLARAADLLVLTRVHPTHEDARAAIAGTMEPAPQGEAGPGDAAWRLGRMAANQAAGWLALRAVSRFFPGTALLVTALMSRSGAENLGVRATAYYRAAAESGSAGSQDR